MHATVNGVDIYYEVHGEGPAVCFITGIGADHHAWEFQVPAFSRAHRVVLLDARGTGQSGKPSGPYGLADIAADVIGLFDHLKIGRAHVVGQSMGGMIAQELVLAAPERVGALVLACTYATPDRAVLATQKEGVDSTAGAQGGFSAMLSGGIDFTKIDPATVLRFMGPLTFSAEFLSARRDWLKAYFERSMSYGFSMESFFLHLAATMTHDARERLRSLRRPTLVLVGTHDMLIPPRCSLELARIIPGSRLVGLGGGSHAFNIEMPEAFNREVLAHLGEHAALVS